MDINLQNLGTVSDWASVFTAIAALWLAWTQYKEANRTANKDYTKDVFFKYRQAEAIFEDVAQKSFSKEERIVELLNLLDDAKHLADIYNFDDIKNHIKNTTTAFNECYTLSKVQRFSGSPEEQQFSDTKDKVRMLFSNRDIFRKYT